MQASPASALLCCSFAAFLLALLLLSLLLLGCTDQTHRSLEALLQCPLADGCCCLCCLYRGTDGELGSSLHALASRLPHWSVCELVDCLVQLGGLLLNLVQLVVHLLERPNQRIAAEVWLLLVVVQAAG